MKSLSLLAGRTVPVMKVFILTTAAQKTGCLYVSLFGCLWVCFICLCLCLCVTIVPTKSDSDVLFCLQLLSKTLTCTLHLS